MYVKSIDIEGFKCFGMAQLRLQYPGRRGRGASKIRNVNLVLGDNGGGKSSVLRALALAILAPALRESGFVPYRLVRRARPGEPPNRTGSVRLDGIPDKVEAVALRDAAASKTFRLGVDLSLRDRGGDLDQMQPAGDFHLKMVESLLFDERSTAFFVAGYGATRRVETGDFSEGSARRSRGIRYQRVASLFEDHVALRPLEAWLPRLQKSNLARYTAAVQKINQVLPDAVRFGGARDEETNQYLFDFREAPTPFAALSDGYKAFIGWVSDLVGHLFTLDDESVPTDQVPGLVLVDEIDLHLHPEWQLSVVPKLASAFPKIQFVFTSHSALIASTVKNENVFVTDLASNKTAYVKQLRERIFEKSSEQILLSSYFGLRSTRPESFQQSGQLLFKQAAAGDGEAALTYLDHLLGAPDRPKEQ